MRKVTLFIFVVFSINSSFAQTETTDADSLGSYTYRVSKWPYFGPWVPSYLAITAGMETFNSHYFFAGIAYNIPKGSKVHPPSGAFIGIRTYYKQHMNDKTNYSYETDVCMMGGICLGMNYSYNHLQGEIVHGFKPFFGFTGWHIQFYYGYCFYSKDKDVNDQLVHNRFTLSFNLPVLRVGKKEKYKDYTVTNRW
ncbi:MAG TPA: hypothetical protein VK177_21450 [Flavobacteriales bacterium]|nr:hypothetical protein [Flavobacteriales bacterium]